MSRKTDISKNKTSRHFIKNNKIVKELNNELFDENYEYEHEISSSLQNNNISPENNSVLNETYIEKLESKIKYQEKVILDLNKYKYICEKRIKQLNPNEIFPLTLDSLSNENIYNSNNKNYLNLNKKYEFLNKKFQILLTDYSDILNNNIQDINDNIIKEGNNNDKYRILKEKYKKLKDENKKIMELLKEQSSACEMQKNIINILRQSIDNDIIKNNELKKYITVDNIIDFTQLKIELEQNKKELVLSQALVNSLKSENEKLNKEKEEAKNNIKDNNKNNSIDKEDNLNNNDEKINNDKNNNSKQKINDINTSKNDCNENNNESNKKENNLIMEENLSLKTTLNSQAQLIKELMEENKNLKNLVDEATIKLNDYINNKNENQINFDNLNYQLTTKINEVKQYEDKLTYFNDYISIIKSLFMNFQESLPKFITIYNKMANEDLNSLLSNSFGQSIIELYNKFNQLNKLEEFDLETNIEKELTNITMELLNLLKNEFISIYEKLFQSNSYYKESNEKIEELKLQIKDNVNTNENNLKKINDINDLLNNEKKNMDEYKNIIDDYKLKLNIYQLENEYLNKKIESYMDDKNNIIKCYYIVIKALSIYNENLSQLLKEYVNNIETKSKLFTEKELILEQLTKNKIKDLNRDKSYQDSNEVIKIVTEEQITLKNLINEFDNKINNIEKQLIDNKETIKQYLLDLQNKPIIENNRFNNNGINNNYNYNYYINQDSINNGNNNLNRINLNYNNKSNLNNLNNDKNNISIHLSDSSNDDDINN